MPVSVIATVKNERKSILALLTSLMAQRRAPDEVVIIDGGSKDGTLDVLRSFDFLGIPATILSRPGCTIARGRNEAIRAARFDLIASTDAGVRLDPGWLEKLAEPLEADDAIDVVGGFFLPWTETLFERALATTTLPALDEIDLARFLPSSRSVAFRKSAWQAVGGYPEWLDYCEDLVFDLQLRDRGHRFTFTPDAIVYFRPRSSLVAFFRQYYRYARGDGKADLWLQRHLLRYTAYALGLFALILGFWYPLAWLPLALGAIVYLWRPYSRVHLLTAGPPIAHRLAIRALIPLIRLVGDIAKMFGYPVGVLWRLRARNRSKAANQVEPLPWQR
ncbi:MAG: glycosyltransferase [Chloroflexi bacterium]|nr:glycosyltransferase [Chloroflexota bacterium]